jgi:hypothetical protein
MLAELEINLFSPYNLPRPRILQSAEEIQPSEKNQLGWKK